MQAGRFVLYQSISPSRATHLWAVTVAGDREPIAIAQTSFQETNGRFSPDSGWISFQSNETGRAEIYVQRFPGAGGKGQVSTNGGTDPKWRRDGREIFFLAPDNRLMSVSISLPQDGSQIQLGNPAPLFTLPSASDYAVTPDGQRVLVNVPSGEATVPPITVVLNWRRPGDTK